jgi:hypothetical protein
MLYPNTMNVMLRVQVYSIANTIQIAHILCGNNKDIPPGTDTKSISLSVIRTNSAVNCSIYTTSLNQTTSIKHINIIYVF